MEDLSSGENFVTVVSVGNKTEENKEKEFVTVLRIGDDDVENSFVTEEVLVYRLPGERLGFGLKFEGGTKATEYVKKLFIQSCAPESPASKVTGSWGHLTEGDEVLVIDSRPVTSMTRMDCVKCLKDSSVVIKLLVRHQKSDLPLVISAEKKRPPALPPTPPPVPPRKLPKKHLRTKKEDALEPKPRLKNLENNNNNPPERKLEGCVGPPEAEYYVDLFSQDSIHSLSESDDTASTISTVVDRNGNSLPTTPKSIQKHLDLSNFPDDESIFNLNPEEKLEFSILPDTNQFFKDEIDTAKTIDDLPIVEPSASPFFQKDLIFQTHDENMNIFNLPRLVDFVPKNFNDMDHKKIMNLFLSCERGEHLDFKFTIPEEPPKVTCFEDELFPKWTISPQLATIGEVEEESLGNENSSNRFTNSPPSLVVDCEEAEEEKDEEEEEAAENERPNEDIEIENQIMEPPPSDRRQPPDGHEFPDFEESFQNRFTSRNPQEIEENVNEIISDTSPLNKMTSLSNMDLSARQKDENKNIFDEGRGDNFSFLTSSSRSQSLCDIRSRTDDTLYHLVEQRKKNLSKLKGLVIPDSISENDTPPAINLPEIKSNTSTLIEQFNTTDSPQVKISGAPSINSTLPPITPPWAATVNFPKYSPAFKRKDLKLHSFSKPGFERSCSMDLKKIDTFPRKKSLDESTSRSESSDYVIKDKRKRPSRSFCTENLTSTFRRRELNTDEESDNDSAVSSSQSSFASRPLDSPSSVENYVKTIPSDYSSSEFRNVKTSSVEALNRKNILASAKCRSGKDFKIGSPVVNRKLENNEDKTEIVEKPVNIEKEEVVVIEEKNVTKAPEKVTKISEEKLPEKVPTVVPKKIVEPPVTNLRNIELRSTRTNPVSSREKNTMFLNTLRPVPTVARREERISKFSNRKSLSVTDLRKNFEEIAKNVAVTPTFGTKKLEFLSKASKTVPTQPPEDLPKIHSKQRISLGSKTTNETKENGGKSRKVVLKPNVVGEHVGITISGGADDNKDITVHRIRYGSVAYQDGTVIKGDHILSINGKPTAGLSYAEAVQLLKVPAESYVIEIEQKDEAPRDPRILKRRSISLDSTLDSESTTVTKAVQSRKPNHEIILIKDQNGLGFSVEGGRDSPQGDVPVIVKKIFQGGVADKDGRLKVGDQILAINDIDFSNLSRIQAWTIMKKVDLGKTKIMIYR